jgi:hypothetical protein
MDQRRRDELDRKMGGDREGSHPHGGTNPLGRGAESETIEMGKTTAAGPSTSRDVVLTARKPA